MGDDRKFAERFERHDMPDDRPKIEFKPGMKTFIGGTVSLLGGIAMGALIMAMLMNGGKGELGK